jgi:phage tail sheath protein FI
VWAFLSTRRIADVIADSIQRAHLWAVDRPVTKQLCESIADSVNSYLRSLTSLGAILGGECWYDRDDNPNGDLSQGIVRFRYKFTPPPPAEHITFTAETVEDYYDVIFSQ